MKYMTRIGQNTGISNTSKNVQNPPIIVLLVIAYQNLNSGRRRMNGRNSSFDRVGSSGPISSTKIRKKITHDDKKCVSSFCFAEVVIKLTI